MARRRRILHALSGGSGERAIGYMAEDLDGAPVFMAPSLFLLGRDHRYPWSSAGIRIGRGIFHASYTTIARNTKSISDWSGDADWSIAIRTALVTSHAVHVWAGGGITADSDPEAEYEETLHKAAGLSQALEQAFGRSLDPARVPA